VINRVKVARWAVVGGVVLTVGAVAGAATKKRWSAGDACLCTPDTQEPAGFGIGARAAGTSAAYARTGSGIGTNRATASIEALAPVLAASGPSFWNTRAVIASDGKAGGVGWTQKVANIGAYSSGSSSRRSPGLGGLWRLMGLNRHAQAAKTTTTAANHKQASAPKRGSSGGSRNGSGGGSNAPAPAPVMPAQPPLFADQTTTIPDLLGAGGIIPGIGAIGGSVGVGGPGLATTPEPGSIFLLGTGVLGLFGMLRRRETS